MKMNQMNKAMVVAGILFVGSAFAENTILDAGEVIKPGTFLGRVVLVNQQAKVSTNDIAAVAKLFADETECNFMVSDKEDGAAIVLRIIDDPNAPKMLLAPEDHWGSVNVAKLVDDLKNEATKKKFLPIRTRRMAIKALSILCGGGASQFQGNIMNTVTMRELDYLKDQIPLDMLDMYAAYLKKLGVTKKEVFSYADACQEGFAPAPANDIQKKIWDMIHEPPSNPITIKYEPKKEK